MYLQRYENQAANNLNIINSANTLMNNNVQAPNNINNNFCLPSPMDPISHHHANEKPTINQPHIQTKLKADFLK